VARKPTEDPELDDDFNDPAPATADDRADGADDDAPEADEVKSKSVGKSVGKTRPTSVGRKNPTDSPTVPKSIFGTDRKANVKGRKLHPLQCSDQKNLTLREHLIGALAILADREGMASQPGKVADHLLEYAFSKLAPDVLAEAYQDVCDDIGMQNDRV
jgi:hypothetical protein